MMSGQSIRIVPLDDGLAEVCFDRQGDAINKFDSQTLQELQEATKQLAAETGLKGILLTSAKSEFIVGADIYELKQIFQKSSEDIAAAIGAGAAIITAFGDLPVPIVAAINGLALGGGFEAALACDYRILAENGGVGLPEVTLGIFPGYGGTVRLPRLIDTVTAAEWITGGKRQTAQQAVAAGAVDTVTPPQELRNAALAKLQAVIASGEWRARRERQRGANTSFAGADLGKLRQNAQRNARHYPAAAAALEIIESTAGMDRDAALRQEVLGLARVARSTTAALIQNFVNDQSVKKRIKGYVKQARPVGRAAVLGAGIMGGGIAFTSASRGVPAIMKDIAQGAVDLGLKEADKLLARQVEQGRLTAERAASIRQQITAQLDYAGFDGVDIVIEAVVEKLAVKKSVLPEVEKQVRPGAVLASNTSSLSIGDLASVLSRPEDFAGMHFFNPVPVMQLVEVIRGPRTSETTAATVAGYAAALGKTPIVVADCPGFLVNRILTAQLAGYLTLLRDGADFLVVDRVMEAFGWPMGPSYLSDVIGMDTLQHVVDYITGGYGERLRLNFPHAIGLMVKQGRLGQKNGAGFYRYAPDAKGRLAKEVDPVVPALLAESRAGPAREFSEAEIVDRVMLPMVGEAVRCLEEGVVGTPAELDTAMLLGIGFPRHWGGPLKYAELVGLPAIVAKADALAGLGSLYAVPQSLRQRAASGEGFY